MSQLVSSDARTRKKRIRKQESRDRRTRGGTCQLCGTTGMVLFRRGQPPQEMGPSADLSFLVD
jgi:hypothetical protein